MPKLKIILLSEKNQTRKNMCCMILCMLSHFSRVQLCNPKDHSPPGSSVHVILQARILECVAISFSRGSSRPVPLMYPVLAACSWPLAPPGKPCMIPHTGFTYCISTKCKLICSDRGKPVIALGQGERLGGRMEGRNTKKKGNVQGWWTYSLFSSWWSFPW